MKNGLFESFLTIVAFSTFSYFYIKTLFRVIDKVVIRPRRKSVFDIEYSKIEEEISLEANRRDKMMEDLAEYSARNPDKTASLNNSYLSIFKMME